MGHSSKPGMEREEEKRELARNAPAIGAAVGGALGASTAPVVAVATVNAVGFTSSGIAAGSTAASMMAAEAVAAGGGVAAGGTVATCQSIGALGALAAGPLVLAVALGGFLLTTIGIAIGKLVRAVLDPFHSASRRPNPCSDEDFGIGSGKWMLATEQGPGNVVFYLFDTKAAACRAFSEVPRILARILYDPAKNEMCAGGWNPFANQTIRRRVNESKERQLPP